MAQLYKSTGGMSGAGNGDKSPSPKKNRGDALSPLRMMSNNSPLGNPLSPNNRTMPISPTAANIDIPLKEPIDIEFKLNKKLAKQLYELEMQEKVRQNREKQ